MDVPVNLSHILFVYTANNNHSRSSPHPPRRRRNHVPHGTMPIPLSRSITLDALDNALDNDPE
ncbi:hypothetical protein VKT23_016147 [Stygiomarasmius scandens]|uniref:Uncharacterized protein n=1 Tax=Marasmiellus scandens TaxID=2682957 RepID=A0ABR1IZ13_9AGAR